MNCMTATCTVVVEHNVTGIIRSCKNGRSLHSRDCYAYKFSSHTAVVYPILTTKADIQQFLGVKCRSPETRNAPSSTSSRFTFMTFFNPDTSTFAANLEISSSNVSSLNKCSNMHSKVHYTLASKNRCVPNTNSVL